MRIARLHMACARLRVGAPAAFMALVWPAHAPAALLLFPYTTLFRSTSQVRNIADVTKAVQAGDLSKKITVDVKGEIAELKNTDRKSTRLNSSHLVSSYAVFCLKKKIPRVTGTCALMGHQRRCCCCSP